MVLRGQTALTSRIFINLRFYSNGTNKVIDTQCMSMVFCFVLAKPQPRFHLNPLLPSLTAFRLPSIQPFSFHALAHSFAQRALRNSFGFRCFRTLSIATGVYPSLARYSYFYSHFRAKYEFASPLFSSRCALFHSPYPATPLFATLLPREKSRGTKTPGVYTNSSHSGLPRAICAKGSPSLPRGEQFVRRERSPER
jgi:hypothetical protein